MVRSFVEEAWIGRCSIGMEVDTSDRSVGRIMVYISDTACVGLFITGSGDIKQRSIFITGRNAQD
jgi:hypothetical protein